MSEIDTSAEAVEELCSAFDSTTWRASERDNTLIREANQLVSVIRALAAERDALAARVALAEGMAEALERIEMRARPDPVPHERQTRDLFHILSITRTALAAWRAAAAEPPASP